MNWNRFSLFKLPNQYRRFEYTPRYYDPKKEERDKRFRQIDAEKESESVERPRREISFRNENSRLDYRTQSRKSMVRLVIILGVLVYLVYYLYRYAGFFDATLESLNK